MLAALLGLLLGAVSLSFAEQDAPSSPDPLPLRRIALPPERVAAELERAKQGTFLKLSREEFEARVSRAAQAGRAAQNPPRLLEARYRCSFTDGGLVGRAQWVLVNPGPSAGLLPLPAFSLALRQARFEETDAVLAEFDGKTLGLLVERPGKQTLALEWSARGEARPGGVSFALRVPACALQSLEIELPRDRTPGVSREVGLVTGPEPAETPGRQVWRVECAGQAQIDLVIRRTAAAAGPAAVLARVSTDYTLAPGAAEVQFALQLEVLRGALRELRCECTPDVQPYRVTAGEREVESWDQERGTPNGPSTLLIRLRDPVTAGPLTVTVHGLASPAPAKPGPKAAGVPWTCPALRVDGVVPRGETLILRVPPDVELVDWNAGRFTLAQAATDAAGWQVLTLHGPGSELVPKQAAKPKAKPSSSVLRPQARLRIQEPEYRVRQQVWWQVGAADQTLTAQLTYQVTQGKLYRLLLQIPAWNVDSVDLQSRMEGRELGTKDLVRTSAVQPGDANSSTLVLDLQRGLGPGTPALLTLRLRQAPPRGSLLPASLSFPVLTPRGVRLQEGALAVSVDAAHVATAAGSEPEVPPETRPAEPAAAGREPPWGKELPDFLYTFRGPPVTGALTLRPRQSQLRVRCRSQVLLQSDRILVVTELHAQPVAGNPQAIDVWLSAPVAAPAAWKTLSGTNQVRRVERVGAAGNLWRLVLAQPLREPLTLQTTLDLTGQRRVQEVAPAVSLLAADSALAAAPLAVAAGQLFPRTPAETRWDIPLPAVLAAERLEGEVALHLPGNERVEAEVHGLTEAPTGPRAGEPTPHKAYRYEQTPVALTLHGWTPRLDRTTEALAERAQLTTTVQRDGLLVHHFVCRVWDWRRRVLPVFLPAEAQLLAVKLNGRWLTPPALAEADAGRAVLNLPVPGSAAALDLELVYSTRFAAALLGARLEAPLPALPMIPMAVRRTWRLPPEFVPLFERHYARLPGAAPQTTVHGLTVSPDGVQDVEAEAWLLAPWRSAHEARWVARQRQELAEAAARAWQNVQTTPERRLGPLLHAVVFDAAREDVPVVLDTVALQQAGLSLTTRLPPTAGTFAWESLGLVHLPCRPAALLTTVPQADAWRATAGSTGRSAAFLAEAVQLAAQYGQDASGRFRRAADWLQSAEADGGEVGRAAAPRDLSAGLAASGGGDWTAWEPLADDGAADTLVVLRQETLPGLAVVLSSFVLVGAWGCRHLSFRRRYALLLLDLLLGVLGLLWLPPPLRLLAFWPTLALGLAAGVWYVGSLLRPAPVAAPAGALGAAVLLLAVGGTLPGQGEAQGPSTVWLLPDSAGKPGQGGVLASPQLLDELEQLSRRGVAGLNGVVLLGAQYEGHADHAAAELTAEFRVWSFTDEPADLVLPLAGVELHEVLLDGAPAFPGTLAAPQTGYSLRVKGRGAHTVRVRFGAQVQQANGEHDLRFTVPRLARSRLQLRLREKASELHAVLGANGGAQQAVPEGASQRLEADLGRTGAFHVRWRAAKAAQGAPQLDVREAYLWHLRVEGGRLQGVLRWTVRRGAVSSLRIDLPDSLEVARVESFSVPQQAPAPRLAGWTVERAGSRRWLRLEFQSALVSAVQVELELIPSRPLTASAALALPVPEGDSPQGGHLALSAEGLEAAVTDSPRVTAVDRAAFLGAWKALGQADPGPLAFHGAFRRVPEGGPLLRLLLNLTPARLQVVQGLTWQVGDRQAVLRATANVTTSGGDELVFVEWEVPAGLTVADVRGPHVRSWSATSGRVQVWLQRGPRDPPLRGTDLELLGWLARPGKDAPFTTPRVRILAAQQQTTHLRVGAAEGWALEPAGLRNLLPLPEPRAGPEHGYVTRDDNAAGTFRVVPVGAGAEVRVLTFVEVREKRLHFVSTIDYRLRQGELRTLTLRLRNWDGPDVRLDADRVAARREYGRDAQRRSWVLDLEPGVTGNYRLQLSGSRLLDGSGSLTAPDVTVVGTTAERWLAVSGSELTAEGVRGLKPATEPFAALAPWPAVADRLRRVGGPVWKVESSDWQVRLRPRPAAGGAGTAQVVWSEHAAARPDGRRWVYESTWQLYQEARTELRLHLPPRAAALALTLDGQDLVPLPAERHHLWLTLPSGSGLRTIRLRWMPEADQQTPADPTLTPPRLDGAAEGPSYWTVQTPAGHTASPRGAGVAPLSGAALELHRAAARLPLSVALAALIQGNRDGPAAAHLQAAQELFYRHCRQAEHLLTRSREQPGAGPRGQSLTEWLHELREQNRLLAQEHEFDRIRQRAERRAQAPAPGAADAPASRLPASLLAARGLPTSWVVPGGDSAAQLHVEPDRGSGWWQSLLFSLLAVLGLGLAWSLQRVSGLLNWLHRLWPEELAAGGILIWLTLGLLLPGLLLFALGLSVRLVFLGRRLAAALRPESAAPGSASSFRGSSS